MQVDHAAVKVIFDALGVTADALKLADATGVGAAAGAVGHGIEIGNNMARALTEFGFKLHKEAQIEMGWQMYKKARDNPGDRKLARSAMRWNSTLSKCVLAYGIVMDGDPIAKEVGRSCGLTPEILADQKDVCPKVVNYFQTLYSDDPQVLRRVPLKQDWHPGTPTLTLNNWARFKAAAITKGRAPSRSGREHGRHRQCPCSTLENRGGNGSYVEKREVDFAQDDSMIFNPVRVSDAYRDFVTGSEAATTTLLSALKSFKPRTGPCPEGSKDQWKPGAEHKGMVEVVTSLVAQAEMMLGEINFDLKEYNAVTSSSDDGATNLSSLLPRLKANAPKPEAQRGDQCPARQALPGRAVPPPRGGAKSLC